MKKTNKKKGGILGKLIAGATAGASVGLATYLYFKNDKSGVKKAKQVKVTEESEDAKADLFV